MIVKPQPHAVEETTVSIGKKTEIYTQSSLNGDKQLIQTVWNLSRVIISVCSYNELVQGEKETTYRFQRPLLRDQVIVRFLSKKARTIFKSPIPNDLTIFEWRQLSKRLDCIWSQLKAQTMFEIQLVAGKSQHVSSSHIMDSTGQLRQYVTINRHYIPPSSLSWKFGSASVSLSVDDFRELRKSAESIELTVSALNDRLQAEYDDSIYSSHLSDLSNDSDETHSHDDVDITHSDNDHVADTSAGTAAPDNIDDAGETSSAKGNSVASSPSSPDKTSPQKSSAGPTDKASFVDI